MVKRLLFSFFLHRLTGGPEPRRRFTLSGRQSFQHRLSGGHELPQAGSPLTGGGFSLNLSGECADAARAHKRVDTCGFHPLVNHPFPLDSLAQIAYM